MMVVFEMSLEPLSELGSDVGVDAGIEVGVEVGVDIGAGVGAEVGIDTTVVDASDVGVLAEEVDDVVVEDELLADDLGRIQNWRLQKPPIINATLSPAASTALMAKGASQSGTQLIVQSMAVFEFPAIESQSIYRSFCLFRILTAQLPLLAY